MKRIIVFILITFTILLSCVKKESITDDKNHALINLDSLIIDNVDAAISRIEYIPLETSADCIIGDISKILYKDSLFFVFDFMKAQSLFIFNEDGSFRNKIDHKGRGPGECLQPMDFCLDDESNIYIYDIGSSKIIKYSVNGEFLNEFKVKIRFDEFFIVDSDKFYFKNSLKDGVNDICLGLYNLQSHKIFTIIPGRGTFDDMSVIRFSKHYFFESEGNVKFCPRFSNEILEMSDTGVKRILTLISESFADEYFVQSLKKDPNRAYGDPNTIRDVTCIYSNNALLHLRVSQGIFNKNILISNKTGRIKCYSRIDRDYYIGDQTIHGVAGDYFISKIPTSYYSKSDWIEQISNVHISDIQKNRLISLNELANPVIICFQFEEF